MVCITSATAQEMLLDWLMDDFVEHGAKVQVSRVNDKFHLSRRWNVAFDDNLQLADTICIFLDRLARQAVESYRYESHRNGQDTITYSIATRGYGTNDDYLLDLDRAEDLESRWTNDFSNFQQRYNYFYPNPYSQQEQRFYELLGGNNRKMYFGAREAVMFDYVQGHGNLIAMVTETNESRGTYYHFDISSLDSLLNSQLSTLNSQRSPVHYSHASGAPVDKNTTYYSTDYLLPRTNGKSESHGTLYVVRPTQGASDLFHRLLDAAKHHLDTNPTQCCVLEYTPRHFKLSGLKNTTKYRINDIAESSFLMADLDKNGSLYILRLDVEGEYWIPRNWKEGKSN